MDNRFKKLRNIVTLLAIIFAVDIVLLIIMMPAYSVLFFTVLAAQAIVVLFFGVLARGLIKEVEETEREENERLAREKTEQKNLKNIEKEK